jgi:hypothetical protein
MPNQLGEGNANRPTAADPAKPGAGGDHRHGYGRAVDVRSARVHEDSRVVRLDPSGRAASNAWTGVRVAVGQRLPAGLITRAVIVRVGLDSASTECGSPGHSVSGRHRLR